MRKLLMLGGAVAVMMTGASQIVQADTANLTVDAVIVATMDVTCATPIDFGNIEPHATLTDTVTIDTAGVRGTGGNANLIAGGTPNAGSCTVTGSDLPYDFSVADGTIDDLGAGVAMAVNTFVLDRDGDGEVANPQTFTLDGGTDTILVGASLDVGAAQVAGTYTGTVVVTANYD